MPDNLKTRLEYVNPDENSYKFWETWVEQIEQIGNDLSSGVWRVYVRYGRIGSEGSVQIKNFTNVWEYREFVSRKIDEKIRKGYVATDDITVVAPAPKVSAKRAKESAASLAELAAMLGE